MKKIIDVFSCISLFCYVLNIPISLFLMQMSYCRWAVFGMECNDVVSTVFLTAFSPFTIPLSIIGLFNSKINFIFLVPLILGILGLRGLSLIYKRIDHKFTLALAQKIILESKK